MHSDGVPVLETMPKSQAARTLLRQLHVTQSSALIQDSLAGSGARLLMQLARRLDGVRCATLGVGRLDKRADLVCEALDQEVEL